MAKPRLKRPGASLSGHSHNHRTCGPVRNSQVPCRLDGWDKPGHEEVATSVCENENCQAPSSDFRLAGLPFDDHERHPAMTMKKRPGAATTTGVARETGADPGHDP